MSEEETDWSPFLCAAVFFVFGLAIAYVSTVVPLQAELQEYEDEYQQPFETEKEIRHSCYDVCRTDYTIETKKEYSCCLWNCDRHHSNFDFSEENSPCAKQPVERECVEWESVSSFLEFCSRYGLTEFIDPETGYEVDGFTWFCGLHSFQGELVGGHNRECICYSNRPCAGVLKE